MIVYLLGFMGAGKSYLGRQLAKETDSEYIDLDEVLVGQTGMSINEIFEKYGEDHFRKIETEVLYKISSDLKLREDENNGKENFYFLGCGGGTPCFNNNMEWMNKHGITVWLNPSVIVLFSRLRNEQDDRPLLKGLGEQELLTFIENKLAERRKYYDLSIVKLNDPYYSLSNILTIIKDAQKFF
jgi:shikimate kinase